MMRFPKQLTLSEIGNETHLLYEPFSEIEIPHKNVREYNGLTLEETNEKPKEQDPDFHYLKMILEPIFDGVFNLRIGSDYLRYKWEKKKFNYDETEYTYYRELVRKELTLEII